MAIMSSGDVFDAYVPPEGDGQHSKLTKKGVTDTGQWIGKKTKTQRMFY